MVGSIGESVVSKNGALSFDETWEIMSLVKNTAQLVNFLDRQARCYPGGIPKGLIRTVAREQYGSPPQCALIQLGAEDGLNERLAALAGAVCTKGLRLPLERCVIRGFSGAEIHEAELEALVAEIGAPVVIICGKGLEAGGKRELGGAVVLFSHSLDQVADSGEIKRQFWGHLQMVIPHISQE